MGSFIAHIARTHWSTHACIAYRFHAWTMHCDTSDHLQEPEKMVYYKPQKQQTNKQIKVRKSVGLSLHSFWKDTAVMHQLRKSNAKIWCQTSWQGLNFHMKRIIMEQMFWTLALHSDVISSRWKFIPLLSLNLINTKIDFSHSLPYHWHHSFFSLRN